MLLLCLPFLGVVTYVIVRFELEKKKPLILFDNSTDGPVTVFVDGNKIASLKAGTGYGSHEDVKVEPGKHVFTATDASGKEIERKDVEIPPKENGRGYRGLFCVGQARRYAIASVVYVAPGKEKEVHEKNSLDTVPPAKPFVELPRDLESYEMSQLDSPFLDSTSIPQGSKFVRERHLCTVTETKGVKKLGCSGFPWDDDD